MELITLQPIIESSLNQLWKDNANKIKQEIIGLKPFYPSFVKKKCTLFLSLNPSLSDQSSEHQQWPFLDSEKPYEENDPRPHRHFKKFFEIGKLTRQTWTFIDLLYVRVTSQTQIKSLYKTDRDFIKCQAKVTLDLLPMLQPKLIVVCSGLAEKILNDSFAGSFNYDNGQMKFNGFPIITRESAFLGSRFLESKVERRELLLNRMSGILEGN